MFEQISEIAEKKKSISSSIEKDLKKSDDLSFQAESEKDFSLLVAYGKFFERFS